LAAFATKVAYDDAVPKRLMSLLEPIFGASFKPLKKWLPEGHALIWLEVDVTVTPAIVAEAQALGLSVPLSYPQRIGNRSSSPC